MYNQLKEQEKFDLKTKINEEYAEYRKHILDGELDKAQTDKLVIDSLYTKLYTID